MVFERVKKTGGRGKNAVQIEIEEICIRRNRRGEKGFDSKHTIKKLPSGDFVCDSHVVAKNYIDRVRMDIEVWVNGRANVICEKSVKFRLNLKDGKEVL